MLQLILGVLSAFICFLHHHNVIIELAESFAICAQLARSAVRLLKQAKRLEDILGSGGNINRAMWVMYGGQWGGAERGGLEREVDTEVIMDDNASDGGWEVETCQ